MTNIPIADAIQQLREQLAEAVRRGVHENIVFTPTGIELELAVNFSTEEKAGGGFKLFAFLDVSVEGKAKQESQHKIKLSLSVSDAQGSPLEVRKKGVPARLVKEKKARVHAKARR